MEGHQPSRGRRIGKLTQWLFKKRTGSVAGDIAVGVTVFVIVALLGWAFHQIFSGGRQAQASATQRSTSSPTTKLSSTTTTAETNPARPPKPRYLASLTSSDGDAPQTGDALLTDRHFHHSIFYPDPSAVDSMANGCSSLPIPCRTTTYDLPANYRTFTATVGVADEPPDDVPSRWRWYVLLDGTVMGQGSVASYQSQNIDVKLGKGNVLGLRLSCSENNYISGITFVWGNARVQ